MQIEHFLPGEDDGRDVGRELGVVGAGRLPEGVGGAVQELLVAEDLVLRVGEDELGDLGVAHVDGEQQGFAQLGAVRLLQQALDYLWQSDRCSSCQQKNVNTCRNL